MILDICQTPFALYKLGSPRVFQRLSQVHNFRLNYDSKLSIHFPFLSSSFLPDLILDYLQRTPSNDYKMDHVRFLFPI